MSFDFRDEFYIPTMITMMSLTMIIVTMKTCNHRLMTLMPSFSSWKLCKVNFYNFYFPDLSNYCLTLIYRSSALRASDPVRFQTLMQSLDLNYQAMASSVAQYAGQRKLEREKDKLAKKALP